MDLFWSIDYAGVPFKLFGPSHLIAIGVIVLVNAALCFWRNPSEAARRRFRYALAAILIVDELILHVWYLSNGLWSVKTNLPLHLCAVLVYVSAAMLITKSQTLFEICYFLGIGGAIQAILTPDNGVYDFPHWRYLSVFISHGSIVTAAFYMTVVERFRPYWRSVLRTMAALSLYTVPIFFLNILLGSDYLFVNRPPDTPSLIDLLGPWPIYLLPLVGIAIALILLLYLPFAVKDWLTRRAAQGRGIEAEAP